jgi:hypothetical protein
MNMSVIVAMMTVMIVQAISIVRYRSPDKIFVVSVESVLRVNHKDAIQHAPHHVFV